MGTAVGGLLRWLAKRPLGKRRLFSKMDRLRSIFSAWTRGWGLLWAGCFVGGRNDRCGNDRCGNDRGRARGTCCCSRFSPLATHPSAGDARDRLNIIGVETWLGHLLVHAIDRGMEGFSMGIHPRGQSLFSLLWLCFAAPLLVSSLSAQNHVLRVDGPEAVLDSSEFEVLIELDVPPGPNTTGWSFGVCHDSAMVNCLEVELGYTAQVLEGGGPPGFVSSAITPDGFYFGVLTSLSSPTLAPGTEYEIAAARYAPVPGAPLSTPTTLEFCDTIESGPGLRVLTVIVSVGSRSSIPDQIDLPFTLESSLPPQFEFSLPEQSIVVDNALGLVQFDLPLVIDQLETGAPDAETTGFSLGFRGTRSLFSALDFEILLPFEPEFVDAEFGSLASGWSLEVVYGGLQTQVLQEATVAVVHCETNPIFFAGSPLSMRSVDLRWTDDVFPPFLGNGVGSNGTVVAPYSRDHGTLTFDIVSPDFLFLRGDANGDGAIDVADAVRILNVLFLGEAVGSCPAALDFNGDSDTDIADAISSLSYLFSDGAPPVAPHPECGTVPGQPADPAVCSGFSGC